MSLWDYIALMRPLNCLMAAFATLIGYGVGLGGFAIGTPVLAAMAAAFLVCAGGQAVNDYFDRNIDARIRPNKPIPSGKANARSALWLSIALFITGVALAATINAGAFAIALVFALLLFAYSAFLARYKYIGNWIIASAVAFTLVFGASIVGNYSVVVYLAAAAMLSNVCREIIKDVEDRSADRERVSLPMLVGARGVAGIVLAIYLAAFAIALYVYVVGIFGGVLYITVVSLSIITFLSSFALLAKRSYRRAHSLSKLGMLIALAAFFGGVFE